MNIDMIKIMELLYHMSVFITSDYSEISLHSFVCYFISQHSEICCTVMADSFFIKQTLEFRPQEINSIDKPFVLLLTYILFKGTVFSTALTQNVTFASISDLNNF